MNVVFAPHPAPRLPEPGEALAPELARVVGVSRLLAGRRAMCFSRDVPSQDLGLLEDLIARGSRCRVRVGFAQLRQPSRAHAAAVNALDLQLQQLGGHGQSIQASRTALARGEDLGLRAQVLRRRQDVLQDDYAVTVAERAHVLLRPARLAVLESELDVLLADWQALGEEDDRVLELRHACRVERMRASALRCSTAPAVWLAQVRLAVEALAELPLALADEVVAGLRGHLDQPEARALVDHILARFSR